MTNAAYTPPPFACSIVVIQTTGQHGKTFKFERKDWCVLGANEDCDIIVPFPGVAQLQALVHVKHNGVFLQGIDKLLPVRYPRLQKLLINEEEVLLLPGDMFLLGERKFLIEYSTENISCTHGSSASKHTLKSPRNATPRTRALQKKRRNSSLVVGEFDEKYVSQRSGPEKLLSTTQLARISQSEQDILPEEDADRTQDDRESSSPREASENELQDEEGLSCLSSSDESTMLSYHNGDVSRNIDFSATENNLPALECNWKQPDTGFSEADRKSSSRARKELVFARLSKGLSATPRKGEKTALIGRTNATAQKIPTYSLSEEAKTFAGKENLPQLYDQFRKASKSGDRNQGLDVTGIRSPLSNRVEIENQVMSGLNQHRTPASMRRIRGTRLGNGSIETPRGRSVAFASTIELAPGAHYSPFRPKQVPSASKSISKSELKKQSGKLVSSARTYRRQGRSMTRSLGHKQKETYFRNSYDQRPAPDSSVEGLGSFFYSKEMPKDALHRSSRPSVEYEDDSNPPTPSSTDEGPENVVSQIPEVPDPSPMARVGGALADFLKRLSGTLESEEEDDSSPETDDISVHKSRLLNKLEKNLPKQALSSSEPVMSSSEVKELSRCMSPERSREFVAQVDSAAEDMRQAMNPISEDLAKEPSSSSRETLATEQATQDVLVKDEDGSTDSLSSSEGNRPQNLPKGNHFGSKPSMTCEESNGLQNQMNTGLNYEADGEPSGPSGSNPRGPENVLLGTGEYSTDSEIEEEAGVCDRESTSLEVYDDPNDTRDSADLEIEALFVAGVNGMNQTDLRSEESEGDELDYGDEEDSESIESSDREVAAVVVDDNEDIMHHLRLGDDSCSDVKDSGDEESELSKSGELEVISTEATKTGHPASTQAFKDESSNSIEQRDSLCDLPCNESDEIKSDSGLKSDGTTQDKHNIVVANNIVNTHISTEIEEDVKVAIELDENEEGDVKDEKHSIPSGAPEVGHKGTQIATLRKELSRLRKDELKAKLLSHHLDASGLKKDLVERLVLHITERATGSEKSQDNSSIPSQRTIEKTAPAVTVTPKSPDTHVTPRKVATNPNSAGDLTVQEAHTMVRRSARKSRAQSPLKVRVAKPSTSNPSLAKTSPTKKSHFIAKSQKAVESEKELDLSLYRRRTVKELRQFLKDRDLDIQQKMRKEELIQHLVTLSIGSDGQNVPAIMKNDASTAEESSNPNRDVSIEPLAVGTLKSHQRMTVTQLRAQLKEREQCQVGTKKTLLDRLSSRPERRTRSGRTVDTTSCLSCQAGRVCEADAKR